MSKPDFKIGTDPEVILLLNGEAFSAEGIVGGDKYEPRQLGDGVKVHEDNILVEYNTRPAENKVAFIREIVSSLYQIHHILLKEKGLTISKECFADFDQKYLGTMQAQTIGCTPEFDAATGEMINPPTLEVFTGRSAGGHIHVGYEHENSFDSMMIVKMLDLYLAVPSLLVDKDIRRRQLYGKASSFRRTDGLKIEYRTLSNFWTFNTSLIGWVYDTVAKVVDEVIKGAIIDEDLYMQARQAINTNDFALAQQIIDTYNIPVPQVNGEDILDAIYADDAFIAEFVENVPGENVEIERHEEESNFEINEKNNQNVNILKDVPLDIIQDTPGFEESNKKKKSIRTHNIDYVPGRPQNVDSLRAVYGSNVKVSTSGLRRIGDNIDDTQELNVDVDSDFFSIDQKPLPGSYHEFALKRDKHLKESIYKIADDSVNEAEVPEEVSED